MASSSETTKSTTGIISTGSTGGTNDSINTTITSLENTIIESVAFIIWKQFCRYYIFTDEKESDSNSIEKIDQSNSMTATTNETTDKNTEIVKIYTAATDLPPVSTEQEQHDLKEIQKEILYYMNDYNIQYEIYKTIQLQTNPTIIRDDVYLVDDNNDNDNGGITIIPILQTTGDNSPLLDPKVLVVLQKAVVQLAMNNIDTVNTITLQKKQELQKQKEKATTTTNAKSTCSFSLFSLLSNSNNIFINWDIICQDSEENTTNDDNMYCIPLYRIIALINIVYIDDIVHDWDDSIYPYLLSLVPINKIREQHEQQLDDRFIDKDYLQMITKLLQLVKKLFHLTRNNIDYITTVQTNIVHIVCSIVETLLMKLPYDDNNNNTTNDIIIQNDNGVDELATTTTISTLKTSSIQLLIDMFIDWTDMNNSGVGSYIDRYFVKDSVKQSIGIRIVSLAIAGISISTTTSNDNNNNNTSSMELMIPNKIIIDFDPTATWFYRWMNTLDWIQICSLFMNKNSTSGNEQVDCTFTNVGQSLIDLLQISTTIINAWTFIDSTTFETKDTTTVTESTVTLSNKIKKDELSIVIYTLSLLRSILMVTCVIKFPWSLLTTTCTSTSNAPCQTSTSSTDGSSNNMNTSDKIVRCRLYLLQLYYKLLSQLVIMSKNTSNGKNRNDKKTTTGSATTTTKIVLPITTISDTIDLCVDAMDTLLSPTMIQPTKYDDNIITIKQIQLIQNSQKLLYHSRIYCSEQYSYIANSYK